MTKPCECTVPGFCPRHKIHKTSHWWKLCQDKENYRAAWDAGKGPGCPIKGRQCAAPEVAATHLAKCRTCPQHRRKGVVQEWCQLDIRPREDGSECNVHAIRAFMPRALGLLPPCPLWRPVGPPRIGYLAPSIFTGGTERWWLQIADYSGCDFVGAAAPSNAWCQPAVMNELKKRMPIYGTAVADCKRLAFDSDLIVSWGQLDYARLLENFRGPIVFVSHGSDLKWTRDAIRMATGTATHWVAVSKDAILPADGVVPTDRFTVLYNGVDPATI